MSKDLKGKMCCVLRTRTRTGKKTEGEKQKTSFGSEPINNEEIVSGPPALGKGGALETSAVKANKKPKKNKVSKKICK